MDIKQAVADYVTAHEIENLSAKTILNIRASLRYFVDWLVLTHNITDTDDLQLAHLRGWISHLQKTPARYGGKRSDGSVRTYGMNMLAFCHWLEQEDVIEKPITTRFRLPRVEKKFIPTFTPEEVEMLLAACDEGDKRKPRLCKALAARNRAIVSILIDAGLRRSEIVGLRLGDIDKGARLLLVHRKGNKWQQVPVSRDGFKPLHEYLTKHRPYLASLAGSTIARKEDGLFLADNGQPLSKSGISRLFQRLSARVPIENKRVSAHNCRRYMATTQLKMGRSPLDVQRQMGHTTLNMTNEYASLVTEDLQRSQERYSPLRAKNLNNQATFGSGYWEE